MLQNTFVNYNFLEYAPTVFNTKISTDCFCPKCVKVIIN